jgi:hypothetical protein
MLVIKKMAGKAMLNGTIVVKQKKSIGARKECHYQIGQGLPDSKHALMDVFCIMGGELS